MRKNAYGFSLIEAVIIVVILGVIAGASVVAWQRLSMGTVNAGKPQYANAQMAVGFALMNTQKFQRVQKSTKSTAMLAAVYKEHSSVNAVIFEGNDLGFSDSGLYLYNLSDNSIYKIAAGGSSAARFMSDHYVVYGFGEQHSDGTSNSIIVLDLQTGQKRTIAQGDATQLTGNACCAVSPDGLRLAIPEKNKVLVWNAADNSTRSVPAQLDPFSAGFPTDPAFFKGSPYFQEISYPTLVWTNNTTLIYADHPPTVMDAAYNKTPTNNRLYALDADTRVSTALEDVHDGIYSVAVANNGGTVFADNLDHAYKFDMQSHTATSVSDAGAQWRMYSSDGSTIYAFTGGIGYINTFSVAVATGVTNGLDLVPASIDAAGMSYAAPESWIGDHLLLVKLAAYDATPNHEWEVVYDTAADKVVQYVQVN